MGQRSPSCVCCACELFRDGWNVAVPGAGMTVTSGEWSRPAAGLITTTDSGARILTTSSFPQHVAAELDVRNNASNATYRLIAWYLDDDNYTYLEYKVGCFITFASSTVREKAFRLVHVTGGVETEIDAGPTPYEVDTGGSCASGSESTLFGGGSVPQHDGPTLRLCYDGEFITATINYNSSWALFPRLGDDLDVFSFRATPHGGQFGVYVDSHSGLPAGFTRLAIERIRDDCAMCGPNCCEGHIPDNLIATIAGTTQDGAFMVPREYWQRCGWSRQGTVDPTPTITIAKFGTELTVSSVYYVAPHSYYVWRLDLADTEYPTNCMGWIDPVALVFDAASSSAITPAPTATIELP